MLRGACHHLRNLDLLGGFGVPATKSLVKVEDLGVSFSALAVALHS